MDYSKLSSDEQILGRVFLPTPVLGQVAAQLAVPVRINQDKKTATCLGLRTVAAQAKRWRISKHMILYYKTVDATIETRTLELIDDTNTLDGATTIFLLKFIESFEIEISNLEPWPNAKQMQLSLEVAKTLGLVEGLPEGKWVKWS